MPSENARIHIDGAARGNPGPAAFAFVLEREGEPVLEHAEVMGKATNNVAEYTALVRVLERAAALGLKRLQIFSDSELLVKQMRGDYRVKNPELQSLYGSATDLVDRFDSVDIRHVRRENNRRADELCNIALDGGALRAPAGAKRAAPSAARPAVVVSDAGVRDDCVECLRSAARVWADGGQRLTPEQVWEQIWSILQEGGVLKKVKAK